MYDTLVLLTPRFLSHQQDLVNFFLLFLRDHYFPSRPSDPFFPFYQGSSLILTPTYHCIIQSVRPGEITSHLLTFLKLFQAAGTAIRSFYAHETLELFFYSLLTRPETDIQKAALLVLANEIQDISASQKESEESMEVEESKANKDKESQNAITRYKDTLLSLCDDREFRDCITTFFLSPDEGMIRTGDRKIIIPIISRILYGRLLNRSSKQASGKQAAILSYLATLPADELHEFVHLSVESFYHGDLTIDPKSVQEVNETVASIGETSPSIRRMEGLLGLLYDIIRQLRGKLKPYVHVYLTIIAYILMYAHDFRRSREGEKGSDQAAADVNDPGDFALANNEEAEEEDATGSEVEDDATKEESQMATRMRRLRTLALRRLTECIGTFPSINFSLYADYFFTPLSFLLSSLPQTVHSAKKPPVLIHLAFIISCNPNLYYLYRLQPLLLKQVIASILPHVPENRATDENPDLTSVDTTDGPRTTVTVEVVQIIENLLRIDPEQDLFNERKSKKKAKNWKKEQMDLESLQLHVELEGKLEEEEEDGLKFLIPEMNNIIMDLEFLLARTKSVRTNFFTRRQCKVGLF